MQINKSLSELTLDDLHINQELNKYKVEFSPDSTVASIIYEHLTSKPGLIKHKRSVGYDEKVKNAYLDVLHVLVSKGAPLEIYISAFSPKIVNPSITNGYIYPDMADLLTLIHLHAVAKSIREVYDYGFRFIIGYRGFLYQDFFKWSDEDVSFCLERLHQLNEVAEKIIGVRNVVRFVDVKELMNKEGDEFKKRLEDEETKVKNLYHESDPRITRKINAWMNDFKKAINISDFKNESELERYLFKHAIHFRSLRHIQFTGGEHNLGICNSFPNVLRATVRGVDEKISLQINPFFRFHSYQRLLVLRKDETWETIKWSDMQESPSSFEPVYFNDFNTPFYFIEV